VKIGIEIGKLNWPGNFLAYSWGGPQPSQQDRGCKKRRKKRAHHHPNTIMTIVIITIAIVSQFRH